MSHAQPLTLNELRELAQADPALSGFSPLAERNVLLVDLAAHSLSLAEQDRIAAWLRQLPCPSIALAGNLLGDDLITQTFDVVVEDATAVAPLLACIQHSPIAATLLVQLLRVTETLPLADALTMESLAYSTLQSGPEFGRWIKTHRAPEPATHTDHGPAVVMTRDAATLTLELNRASNRNGMTVEMRDALIQALQLVLADDSIRHVHISGRGKCFSTGGDLTEFGSAPDPATAHVVRSLALPGRLLAQCAARVEVRVHGACIGSGIEFPAFASRIVAAKDAYFQLPELKYGLIPGAGGTVSIAQRIGRQRTAWLALSGRRINARQALAWGLVDRVDD
ncbi:MAG: enoyl-CoA hydratase/isomerase family protein [Stenotrophobium sp.]